MCTVVCSVRPHEPVRILALRDEFVGREFDDPGAWWPAQPTVVGGRDRVAGGSWCVSDVATGVTALLVNRVERREGTPSRGLLPLAAVAAAAASASATAGAAATATVTAGGGWPAGVEHRTMAAFNLVVAGPAGIVVWIWDAASLRRVELGAGTHMITSPGIDAGDAKTTRFAPRFATESWLDVVTSCVPSAQESALVVRHHVRDRTYATVFGQLITAAPGSLQLAYSRTPWTAGTWTERAVP